MKIKHVLLALILVFTLWFVGVMYFHKEDFNYYQNVETSLTYQEYLDNEKGIAFSKEEMYENLEKKYPIHYFLLKNQLMAFIFLCVVSIPYEKIYKYFKK